MISFKLTLLTTVGGVPLYTLHVTCCVSMILYNESLVTSQYWYRSLDTFLPNSCLFRRSNDSWRLQD